MKIPTTTNIPWQEESVLNPDRRILSTYLKRFVNFLQNTFYSEIANAINENSQFNSDITVAGAGTDGTISSRSANPLGECDGFAKIELKDGTTVYVPYWGDIAP
jgi:hypothetical protein